MTTAVMIGATGLVGSKLLEQLLADARFTKVVSFGRRPSGQKHEKLEEHVIDFDRPEAWASLVKGDVAFSALGTTIKQAGSKEVQKKIDLDYQLEFAKAAAKNGVSAYSLCSAASADPRSSRFYSRIKGELDRDVQALGFQRVRIMRPSLLGGDRGDRARTGEKLGSVLLGAFNAIGLAKRYREIPGSVVARAMLNAAMEPTPGVHIFELDEVFSAAGVS
ncbi:MAG: NAD(P)H-binding protein [Myxococcaceae bacterium]|nr:NAD(P)H-binding protein [Myxococcaceae bacterium]